jgi:dihydropteroate synthase
MSATTRLIEPASLLHGPEAAASVRAGVALPLAGTSTAFTLATLIEGDSKKGPYPVEKIPSSWDEEVGCVTSRPPQADLPETPLVMGIVNVTPDSFSDGGRYVAPEQAISHAEALLRDGADLLDLGAESTRPGAAAVSWWEEWRRLEPVVASLAERGCLLSIDTRNARTMEAALKNGAAVINDVTALEHDPDAIPFLAAQRCPVVLMHMRGTPETMAGLTSYSDVAVDVVRELAARIAAAEAGGIARERLLIDPGIGFAKTTEQNAELLRRLPIFANLGCRMLLGTSRKRMIGALSGVTEAARRDPGTIVTSLPGLVLSNTLLRVHDCAGMSQALKVWQGCYASP